MKNHTDGHAAPSAGKWTTIMQAADPRPYDGIRIVDLTRELGSYCTRLFADLGAEVIRVEPPGGGDDRRRQPGLPGAEATTFGGIPFAFLNVNKKSVVLDAATPSGLAVLQDLIATAQVVVHQPAPDVAVALSDILAVPGLRVVTSISHLG
jgi:benzylsuccinate CoA-transferase BbsE subunit